MLATFADYMVMILEEKASIWGHSHRMHFHFEKCEMQSGGMTKKVWTSFNLSAMFLESHVQDGANDAGTNVKLSIQHTFT